MSSFVIEGGYKLSGAIRPQGAKNEALEVISATLLTDEEVTISNIPEILDVRNLIILLEGIGVKVTRLEKGKYTFKADSVDTEYVASDDFVRKCSALRGSVMVVGPLLARFGQAYFPKPGGDKIGRRRVDTHITGMIGLGAALDYDAHKKAFFLHLPEGRRLTGKYMLLDEASVTGTANILMAATLAEGTTTIYNAAIFAELEIVERYNHSLMVGYVPLGRDAAVAGTYKNLRFKNNTDQPIVIETYLENNNVVCDIYGHETRDPDRKIDFESVWIRTIGKPAEKVTQDPNMYEDERVVTYYGKTGAKIDTYKLVLLGINQGSLQCNV